MNDLQRVSFSLVFSDENQETTMLRCSVCSCNIFNKKAERDLHIKEHHPHLVAAAHTITCGSCSNSFDCPNKAALHHNLHKPRHVCELCDKRFRYRCRLERHQIEVHNSLKRSFDCEYCCKSFCRPSDFKSHMNVCLYARHLICIYCNKAFESKEMLHGHKSKCEKGAGPRLDSRSPEKSNQMLLRIESSEDSLSNDQNQDPLQGFTNAANNTQQASFTLVSIKNSVLLSCGICRIYLKNQMNLCKMHIKTDHPHLEAAGYVFTCSSCSNSFDCPVMAAKHYHETHMPRLACEYCSQTFKNRHCLLKHERRAHHVKRSLQCEYCSKQFRHRTNFEEHRKCCISAGLHFCVNCYSVFESEEMLHEHEFNCNEIADPSLNSGFDLELLDDLLDTLK